MLLKARELGVELVDAHSLLHFLHAPPLRVRRAALTAACAALLVSHRGTARTWRIGLDMKNPSLTGYLTVYLESQTFYRENL